MAQETQQNSWDNPKLTMPPGIPSLVGDGTKGAGQMAATPAAGYKLLGHKILMPPVGRQR